MVTSALMTRRSKSSDQMAHSTLATSPTTSSWTRRPTMSNQLSSNRGVLSAQGAVSKKSMVPINSALATSSTSRVRNQGKDLQTS